MPNLVKAAPEHDLEAGSILKVFIDEKESFAFR